MPGFIKHIVAPEDSFLRNGSVGIKTYNTLRESLLKKTRFSIIRSQGMGDILLSVVVVEALSRVHPGSEITFHALPQYHPILKRFDFIDRVGTMEDIDTSTVLVDLMGKIDYLPLCNKDHRLDLLADEAGVSRDLLNYDFSFAPSTTEKRWATKFLKELGVTKKNKLIGLHIKSYADIRTWDSSYDLVKLVLKKLPASYKVILFEKERHIPPKALRTKRVINATGETTLTQLLSLVNACSIIVAPDSGIMHLAGMMKRPFIGLFGPIDPDFRIRYYSTGEALWGRNGCAPCWDWQTQACHGDMYKRCLRDITPKMVLERVERLLTQ
jgi:heptosyltransferase-2